MDNLSNYIWGIIETILSYINYIIDFIKEIITFIPKHLSFLLDEIEIIFIPVITLIVFISIYKFLK